MRFRKVRSFKSRLQLRHKRRRNEVLVTGRGCFRTASGPGRSANGFPAALIHQSLRGKAGATGEFPEFRADFRLMHARGYISHWRMHHRAGAGEQSRHRGGAISPRCQHRHHARKRWRVIARIKPAGERSSAWNWRSGGPLLTNITASSTPAPAVNSNFSDVALITEQPGDLSVTGALPLSRSPIPQYDPSITGLVNWAHQTLTEFNPLITGYSNWLVENKLQRKRGIYPRPFDRRAARCHVRQHTHRLQRGALHLQSYSGLESGTAAGLPSHCCVASELS